MDENLDRLDQLCKRHPNLGLNSLSVTCGAGWFALLEAALLELESLQKATPGLQYSVVQATEKFGALRLYISVPNGTRADVEAVGALISWAEQGSRSVCERCGAAGVVRERAGWLSTRCTSCFENSMRNRSDEE